MTPGDDAAGMDGFGRLRTTTPARIGLGRIGDGLPLSAQLDLVEAHARARDAVHGEVDFRRLATELAPLETIAVRSRAPDRATYLRRPDLGRRLDEGDLATLDRRRGEYDVGIVVADGLSASAVNAHATTTIRALLDEMAGYRIAPVVLAAQARVALGDEIGQHLGARIVVVLIGERPGLTISDSLGIYVTAGPRVGQLDSERNCISNIHRRGLAPTDAARQCAAILAMARQIGRTGTHLKLASSDMGEPSQGGMSESLIPW